MMDDSEQFQHEFRGRLLERWDKILAICWNSVASSTVPIFGQQNDQLVHDRTGILFQVAHKHFVITAGHEIQGIVDHRIPLYLGPATQGGNALPIDGQVAWQDDSSDIAVIELSPDCAETLSQGRRAFLHTADTDCSNRSLDGLYLVFGYPRQRTHSETNRHTRVSPFAYCTHPQEDAPVDAFDPNLHLVLRHNKRSDDDRNVTPPPRVGGMSGCGVWWLDKFERDAPNQEWTLDEMKLVAIQNSCFHGRFFKATWFRYAVEVIRYNWPELERPLSLIY